MSVRILLNDEVWIMHGGRGLSAMNSMVREVYSKAGVRIKSGWVWWMMWSPGGQGGRAEYFRRTMVDGKVPA